MRDYIFFGNSSLSPLFCLTRAAVYFSPLLLSWQVLSFGKNHHSFTYSLTTIWFPRPEEIPYYIQRSPEPHALHLVEVLWSLLFIGNSVCNPGKVRRFNLVWTELACLPPVRSHAAAGELFSSSVCFLTFIAPLHPPFRCTPIIWKKSGNFMFQLIVCNTFTTIGTSPEYHQSLGSRIHP